MPQTIPLNYEELSVLVATFYKFVPLASPHEVRQLVLDACAQTEADGGILGTVLLAEEGINGTVAGSSVAINDLLATLKADDRFADVDVKFTDADEMPFHRLKVKIKPEIVAIRAEVNPAIKTGTYVDAQEWNELLDDDEVIVIDTRNDYEVAEGTFPGAIDPKTAIFSEFPAFASQNLDPKRDRKVALFCTGGIRCEKATAYLLEQGFENVYHLHGGIIRYLQTVTPDENRFEGSCFVFDDRRTIV